jgi:hypothetical protein
MSGLATELERYLELRRQMGFKLRRAEKLLRQFVAYCEAHGIEDLLTELPRGFGAGACREGSGWLGSLLMIGDGDLPRDFVLPPKSWRVSYAASGLVLDSLIS